MTVRAIKRIILYAAALFLAAPSFAQAHSATLSWTASADAAANPTLGYNVYREPAPSAGCPATVASLSGFTKLNSAVIVGTSYVDSTVTIGAYCFVVTAVLNGAESAPSNVASGRVLPAPATLTRISGIS